MYGTKRPQIAKTILRKQNEARNSTLPAYKLYYRTMIIKTARHRQKNRHTDQWNRMESLGIKSPVYGQVIFDKGAKNIQWRQ